MGVAVATTIYTTSSIIAMSAAQSGPARPCVLEPADWNWRGLCFAFTLFDETGTSWPDAAIFSGNT